MESSQPPTESHPYVCKQGFTSWLLISAAIEAVPGCCSQPSTSCDHSQAHTASTLCMHWLSLVHCAAAICGSHGACVHQTKSCCNAVSPALPALLGLQGSCSCSWVVRLFQFVSHAVQVVADALAPICSTNECSMHTKTNSGAAISIEGHCIVTMRGCPFTHPRLLCRAATPCPWPYHMMLPCLP